MKLRRTKKTVPFLGHPVYFSKFFKRSQPSFKPGLLLLMLLRRSGGALL